MINNIQTLFSSIQIEEVKAYLTKNGWAVRESTGRLDFTKQVDNSGETRNLFLPADPAHPKFRKLIPNLVFNLAVLENREALNIANDIASSVTRESTSQPASKLTNPDSPTSSRLQIGFRNLGPNASCVQMFGSEVGHKLKPGEEVLVEFRPSAQNVIFGFSGTIELAHDAPDYGVMFGPPIELYSGNDVPLISWLKTRLATIPGEQPERLNIVASIASPLVARFQFAVTGNLPRKGQADTILRAASFLLCGLASELCDCPEAATLVFELARHALAPAKLTFEIKPNHELNLWHAARNDDSNAPVRTLDWLEKNAYYASLWVDRTQPVTPQHFA